MKYDFISFVERWLPDGATLAFQVFFHSQKGEHVQRIKKLNDILGV